MQGIHTRLILAILIALLSTASAQKLPSTQPQPGTEKEFAGQLLDKTGHPLPGTKMCLCTGSLSALIELKLPDDVAGQNPDFHFATTDKSGGFSFPAQKGDYVILAYTDAGYVIAQSRNLNWPATLKITPWASVEGNVTIGEKAGPAKINIQAWNYDQNLTGPLGPYLYFHANTDGEGHFVFDRLPAGNYTIARWVYPVSGRQQRISVASGQTTKVTIPIVGRSVTGRIGFPAEYANDRFYSEAFPDAMANLPDITLPNDILTMTIQQRADWFDHWMRTPEGRRLSTREESLRDLENKPIQLPATGAFRIEDMPPGAYFMIVRFFARSDKGVDYDHVIANVVYQFAVTPIPQGSDEIQVDLGLLTPKPSGPINEGQITPDIVFPTLDGKQLQLSQFKGKYVLLDFWGTWCPGCVNDLPKLKAIYDAYGANPNFAMMSLSVDDEEAKVQKYVIDNGIKWKQGILGDRDKAWQAKLFEVTGYPSYWLIGPDGKVLGNSWIIDELKPILERAMAK